MLDVDYLMVTDQPSWQNGRELQYGSLHEDARRPLTAEEIEWNDELISEEGAASASPSAATASTLGAAVAPGATPSASVAPAPTSTSRSESAADNAPQAATAQSGGTAKRFNDSPEDGAMLKSKARPAAPPQAETTQSGGTVAEGGAMLQSKAVPRSPRSEPTPPWRKVLTGPPGTLARGPEGPPPPRRDRLMLPTESPPARPTLTKEVDVATEAERARRAHVEAERDRRQAHMAATASPHATSLTTGTASHRAQTAKSSKEEMKKRREQREAATAAQKPGAATAHLTFANQVPKLGILEGEEAAQAMQTKPTRLPDLVLQGPHEAAPSFHDDWTIVPGDDPDNWEKELKLRDSRNRLLHSYLIDGRTVFYKSSGNSMWPLLQSGDACTFHPIQAVTARDGREGIDKEASEIGVGDVVFCQVQRSQQYYAHIVLSIEHDYHAKEQKYWIGNIQQRINGWCFREHIFGILAEVQVDWEGRYYTRPHPKSVYEEVRKLVDDFRWSRSAASLCEPSWDAVLGPQ